ncbi:MAG: hypothetical protein II848_03780, partial [Candidatus Methanomethylophilus sp.]|nr:hypothetical protein [Methanomethylophilus sp.]
MKGRYLIVAAVFLLSVSVLAFPGENDESSATTSLTPGDLTNSADLSDSFQTFYTGGQEYQIKASGPVTQEHTPAVLGVYNNETYVIADSYPENYPSGTVNEITIRWTRNNQDEERTFTLTNLGADVSTSIFMLKNSGGIQVTLVNGGISIPSTFGDVFYVESTEPTSSLSTGLRTDSGCIIDITNGLFKGSIRTGNYRFSVTAESLYSYVNGVLKFDLANPITITNTDDPDKTVTLTCTEGNGSNFSLSLNMGAMNLSNAVDNHCSVTAAFGDGSSITYSNYNQTVMMLKFNSADPTVISPYLGYTTVFHREQGSPTIWVEGNGYGFADSGDVTIQYGNDGSANL